MIPLLLTSALAAPLALPVDGPLHPASSRFVGDIERFARVDDCTGCHEDAAHSWAGSTHAHASLDNPWYLASLQIVRDEVGPVASRHCAACHDPALLATGAIDEPVLDLQGPLADLGVPCLGCHGVVDATGLGNGSYVVDVTDLPDPETDLPAHRARMASPALTDGTACQGCHRGVLVPDMGAPHVMTGFDDWGAWQSSGWAGTDAVRLDPNPQRATCTDCHGHAMEGGRTAIQPDHLLHDAVTLWIPQLWVDGVPTPYRPGMEVPEGSEVVVDAVVRNTGTGHRFPGGLGDTQDTRLVLSVDTPSGRRQLEGPSLRALPIDRNGSPVREHLPHRIAAGAADHTVPPGEAQLLQVAFVAPGGPIDLDGQLVHRPHRPELADAACLVTTPFTLDGCAPLPETLVTRAQPEAADTAEAFHALALARSRARTEDLPQALDDLQQAVDLGLPAPTARVIEARILGRQGRIDAALAALEGLPDHPAVHATRARAHLAVWRFDEALPDLRAAVAGAPLSTPTWVLYAEAAQAAGHADEALDAALTGLELAPRHPDLLRIQAMAADALDHADTDAAWSAWEAHRRPDGLDRWRMTCERTDDECARRGPVPFVDAGVLFDPIIPEVTP